VHSHSMDTGPLPDRTNPFLKVHTHKGHVYVLDRWELDAESRVVTGAGLHYDADRRLLAEGDHAVPYDRVALLETNRPRTVYQWQGGVLGLATGATAAMSLVCIAKPKLCFGSCPTFYVDGGERPLAEGFSASVARVLEATDVDSLFGARARDGRFELEMRNEALETHFVRRANLLVLPRQGGRRVMRAGGTFFAVGDTVAPVACQSEQGRSCREAVATLDGDAWASKADPEDLGASEEVRLTFPAHDGPRALAVAARNSLVQTFLFYEFLARLGPEAGDWMAAVDRGGDEPLARALDMAERVAPIRVEVRGADGDWIPAGRFDEVGPIAQDVQLVTLPEVPSGRELEVRLRLTKGYWKVDWLAAVPLHAEVSPRTVEPSSVSGGRLPAERALGQLLHDDRHLITYPGERYTLAYEVPDGDHDLFLETRGYYYEWPREGWFDRYDLAGALRFVLDPDAVLRELAPAYKRIEAEADAMFWKSRVGARP
jgi:hypothetical protein